jgi:hypothetical protein
MEGSGRGLFKVLYRHLPGDTKGKHENLDQVVSFVAQIRTEHLQNTSPNRYGLMRLDQWLSGDLCLLMQYNFFHLFHLPTV